MTLYSHCDQYASPLCMNLIGSGCSGGPTRAAHVNATSGDVSYGESHAVTHVLYCSDNFMDKYQKHSQKSAINAKNRQEATT